MDKPSRSFILLCVAAVAAFTPSSASAAPPDLCEDPVLTVDGGVYEDTAGVTISRWCEPHTVPPPWGGEVCCTITDEADCMPPSSAGRCATGMKFTCEYGEQIGDGVVCYQPGPSACDLGACTDVHNPNAPQLADTIWICCVGNAMDLSCTHAGMTEDDTPPDSDCGGFLAMCDWGATNLDGTVDCYG